jgi:hypothetical protein
VATYLSTDDPDFWGKGPEWSADARRLGAMAGYKIRHFVMADSDERPGEDAQQPPVVALMYMPPGCFMPRHSHASPRLEFILEGSYECEGRVLGRGDVMVSGPGETYGPNLVGPDGVLSVEIFSTPAGIGGQMEDSDLDTKSLLRRLQEEELTPQQREEEMRAYAERIRAQYRVTT